MIGRHPSNLRVTRLGQIKGLPMTKLTRLKQLKNKHCRGKAGRLNPAKGSALSRQTKRPRSGGAKRRRDQRAPEQTQQGHRDLPKRICYHRPPRNRTERLHRIGEQRRLARRRGKNWNNLTRAEQDRRIRFGSHARVRNARDVYDLATLNCQIAHERELRACPSSEHLAQLAA